MKFVGRTLYVPLFVHQLALKARSRVRHNELFVLMDAALSRRARTKRETGTGKKLKKRRAGDVHDDRRMEIPFAEFSWMKIRFFTRRRRLREESRCNVKVSPGQK